MSQKLPPRDADAVLQKLQEDYPDMPAQLQRAARFMLDHPHEVGVHSMRSLAALAEIQPNSLMRLAKHLHFDGYESLREKFRDFLRSGMGAFPNRADWLQSLAVEGGSEAVFGQMASASLSNLEQMFQSQDLPEINDIIERILNAERVFVTGVGAAYAVAYHFWYVGRMAFDHLIVLPRQGSTALDDVARITPKDLLIGITFQPYRSETLQAARHAKTLDCPLLALTDSRASPLARLADVALIAPTHTPHFFQSHTAVIALIETLLALMIAKGGKTVSEKIAGFHRARWDAGFYEEEPR